jgi:hypothetical protein
VLTISVPMSVIVGIFVSINLTHILAWVAIASPTAPKHAII